LLDSQGEILYLSSLYSQLDVPYKAAEVLERGLRDGTVESSQAHWSAVADAWYAAEELEKSLASYQEAGRVAVDGSTDLRRGYLLVDLERWQEALEALDSALEKGGLNQRMTAEAFLLRGMAHFHLGAFGQARTDWDRAGQFENTRESARQWLNHMREERRRSAS
jgi:tetratricopeptide (TPR) repeat protein